MTMLPTSVGEPLRKHLERGKVLYQRDLEHISDGFTQAPMLLMLRQAQHERVFPQMKGLSVRPEPVEG